MLTHLNIAEVQTVDSGTGGSFHKHRQFDSTGSQKIISMVKHEQKTCLQTTRIDAITYIFVPRMYGN